MTHFTVTFAICQIASLSNFKEYAVALDEATFPGAATFVFCIIFCITLLCFNLFVAVVSYSFNQLQQSKAVAEAEAEAKVEADKVEATTSSGNMLEESKNEDAPEEKREPAWFSKKSSSKLLIDPIVSDCNSKSVLLGKGAGSGVKDEIQLQEMVNIRK